MIFNKVILLLSVYIVRSWSSVLPAPFVVSWFYDESPKVLEERERSAAYNVSGRFYPRYHLAPPHGWMNDPNGFSYFKGEYHLFYQYNPLTSQDPGIAHWGHARSPDLFHWEHLPIALYPDQPYDKTGVFSGSALIEDDKMYILYTGNVNFPNQTPDHEQQQALATSTDGVNVTKYSGNPVIKGNKYQPNIRDPKVWKHKDTYYIVLGNSFDNNTLGRVLLFSSKDLITWKKETVLDESDGSLGYMWECPDFFLLGGKYVLLFSPQGIKPQGDKYRNLYQTGYIIGDFDYKTLLFTALTDFRELDRGHDFYATQTIEDKTGQRILVAWCDMWEQDYPERNDGWTGQMIIPRTLTLSENLQLIQKPVKSIFNARGKLLYKGKASANASYTLPDNTAEIVIRAPELKNVTLLLASKNESVVISYDYIKGKVTLDRGGEDGIRRTKWRPQGQFHWRVFVDASSIELFCGDGEVTFSSRFFPTGNVKVKLINPTGEEDITVHAMKRTVSVPED